MKRILSLLSLLTVTACSVRATKADPPLDATYGNVTLTVNARLVDNAPAQEYKFSIGSFNIAVPVQATHRFICAGGGKNVSIAPGTTWDQSEFTSATETLIAGPYSAYATSQLDCDSVSLSVQVSRAVSVHF